MNLPILKHIGLEEGVRYWLAAHQGNARTGSAKFKQQNSPAASYPREGVNMAMWKALIPGILLTWIVAGLIGSNGSKGGVLTIHYLSLTGNGAFNVPQNGIYWSWPLFVCATLLGFAIFKMMD